MPIKMNVNAGDAGQIGRAFSKLVDEMKEAGVTSGILAAQSCNQMHWSADPEDEGYKKHGFIGDKPDDATKSTWSGKVHTSEGLTFDGYDGTIDVLGGDWQNAVSPARCSCLCVLIVHTPRAGVSSHPPRQRRWRACV